MLPLPNKKNKHRMTTPLLAILVAVLITVAIVESAEIPYTFTPIKNAYAPLAINDKDQILIERQLVKFADPVPLIVYRNGHESKTFQCPGVPANDTTGEGF